MLRIRALVGNLPLRSLHPILGDHHGPRDGRHAGARRQGLRGQELGVTFHMKDPTPVACPPSPPPPPLRTGLFIVRQMRGGGGRVVPLYLRNLPLYLGICSSTWGSAPLPGESAPLPGESPALTGESAPIPGESSPLPGESAPQSGGWSVCPLGSCRSGHA